jgi:hypothetical protein
MLYTQLISSLRNKIIYLKISFTSGFGEIMFHFWYNNIKVGVFRCQSNFDTVCGVQSISLLSTILVRCLYWVLITPKNFICTPLGVIYPSSPTPAVDSSLKLWKKDPKLEHSLKTTQIQWPHWTTVRFTEKKTYSDATTQTRHADHTDKNISTYACLSNGDGPEFADIGTLGDSTNVHYSQSTYSDVLD